MKKSDISNLSGGVVTVDGRTLYGIDAEHYLKMKSKEDPDWERKLGEWIEDALGEPITDTSDLYKSLKSGVVLCQLLNKIKPGIIKKYNEKKPLFDLHERDNIQIYLDGCKKLGMNNSDLFDVSDLHNRRTMSAVLKNIYSLSKMAQLFENEELIKRGDLPPAPVPQRNRPNWELNYQTQAIYSEQLEDDLPTLLKQTQQKLNESLLEIQKLQHSNVTLKNDLNEAREKLRLVRREEGGHPLSQLYNFIYNTLKKIMFWRLLYSKLLKFYVILKLKFKNGSSSSSFPILLINRYILKNMKFIAFSIGSLFMVLLYFKRPITATIPSVPLLQTDQSTQPTFGGIRAIIKNILDIAE